MPLEPRLRAFVALVGNVPRPDDSVPFSSRRAAGERASHYFRWVVLRPGPKVESITHRSVPVEGGRITVRLYRPFESGRLPLHVYIHGGGWCEGTLDERDDRCKAIAVDAACVVASVEYRLAPECQYPTAPEDCYAALCWLVEHAEELGADAARVTIGGESAGGNLAAVACLMARDRNGPSIAFQMLDVPATDFTLSHPSITDIGEGYLLTRRDIELYREAYLGDLERATEPYASPLLAPDLSGLPPAQVMTAEYDPLRDEGAAYAERLREAGVDVEHVRLAGHIHPSFSFTQILPSARDYHRRCVTALRRATAIV
jgi:acetyl esterase/lipase